MGASNLPVLLKTESPNPITHDQLAYTKCLGSLFLATQQIQGSLAEEGLGASERFCRVPSIKKKKKKVLVSRQQSSLSDTIGNTQALPADGMDCVW